LSRKVRFHLSIPIKNMKDAFLIAATLDLQGNADKALARIVANFGKAGKQADFLKENLKKLGIVLDALSPGFTKLTDGLKSSTASMRLMNNAFTSFNARLEASGYRMETVIGKAERLKAAMAGVGDAVASSNTVMAPRRSGNGGGGGRRHGGGIHARPFHFGVFGFSAPTLGAAAAGYGAYESIKQDASYEQAFAQFQAMNLGANANASANKFAMNLRSPGVSRIEAMHLLRDSTVIMKGNYEEGEKIAPAVAKVKYTSNALGYATTDADLMKILRLAEMRGGFKNPTEMMDQLAYASQGIAAFGGTVTPKDMQNFMRTGGVAALSQSDKTFWLKTLPIIQELGGNRTGTALMSLYSAFGAGRTTTAAAMELDRLGLVKPGFLKMNKMGMIQRIKPGGIVNNEQFTGDFIGWLFGTMFPTMQKKGINTQAKALQELATVLPNRTSANIASQIYIQEEKIKQEYGMASNAMNYKQQQAIADKTPQGQLAQFEAAASDLGVAFGKLLMPAAIEGMKVLTSIVYGFMDFGKSLGEGAGKVKVAVEPAIKALTTPSADTGPAFLRNWLDKSKHPTPTFLRNLLGGHPANAVPPVNNQPIQVHTSILLKDKEIARATTKHQSDQMSRTMQTGTNYPDANMNLPWRGWTGV
jgi:hypothetical protein